MKNFIFISPNFPENYWHFCRELKNNGLNVLGIGDAPYDYLCPELKDSLNEYYKVGSLENYDEVLTSYRNIVNEKNALIDKLFKEIKVFKKLKV